MPFKKRLHPKKILEDDYLKSYSLVKSTKVDNKNNYLGNSQGSGLYTKNKFVYFSCTDRLFDERILGGVILYFEPKLLSNRIFYTANQHIINSRQKNIQHIIKI